MKQDWRPVPLEIGVLAGKTGTTEYTLRYPKTPEGSTAFDRWWLRETELLRRRCTRIQEPWPVRVSSEWQETLQCPRAISGFVDINRQSGYAGWQLKRISATFFPGEREPVPLSALLLPGMLPRLLPGVEAAVLDMTRQAETPFYRSAEKKALKALPEGGYYLTGEGLAIWLPQETIAPANGGLPTVLLPYESLKGLLRFSF